MQMELKNDEAIKDEVQAVMQGMYPDKKGKINHRPLQVHKTTWSSNDRFGGMVAQYVVGAFANTPRDGVAMPVGVAPEKPVVFFAGEACDETYFGSVYAAYDSGERAANHILKSI